ncbi:S-methyl-5-thioribose kinase [Comamonas sp. JC664]|uniref:S-methyl-5-thioribose kinase n=1 Tax=Comamonas sp. JC664 TaxID=2801917 RepID=UPI00191D7BCF|nr:S-methyl-5-thioribose kinase [Comamonas sp. JC664]MBL0695550.1 S-methyl-5-thioribose kinase [Comamonas sp. JC664]GHG62180.1 methylthioribose kinase [Comamonas sp. KCTC 72670]
MSLTVPEGYHPLHARSVPAYLASQSQLEGRLGGGEADWRVQEVSDGNVNQVFLVHGPAGSVCVKQSLPYVRLVGESWPLTLERIHFEHQALLEHGRHARGRVPQVLHHDARQYVLVLECLTPHIILRKGMTAGVRYPRFAEQMADYLARTLFFSSDLALSAEEKRRKVAAFSTNTAMCRIMEDMVFTEPYQVHPRNRWTSPQLDALAADVRGDMPLKLAASRLKYQYLTRTEALIHGDLHTGSIMVTPEDTRVIDQEFAFYGPMAFDVGALLANLLINYFSQEGHTTEAAPREPYQDWVLETMETLWSRFQARFLALWEEHGRGDAYPTALFTTEAERRGLTEERQRWLQRLLGESLSFAGVKMLRRIFGLAHNLDLDSIEDPHRRAACERACVELARSLLLDTGRFHTLTDVTAAARALGERAPRRRV